MKRQCWYVATAMLLVVMGVNAILAQPRERTPGAGERERLSAALNLSEDQKAQIHKIMLDTRKKNIDTEAKLELAHLELQELLRADNPDQKKIDAQITEVSKLRETMLRARIDTRLAIQKVLTPEQRKKTQGFWPFGRGFGEGHGGGPERGMHKRGEFRFHQELPENPEEF